MRPYDSLDSVRRGAATMIARIWRGWTTPANADAYQRIVCQEVLPGIAARNLEGYHGAYLLRHDLDGEVEFATILLFDSLEQVRAFAGEDYETAYVPPRTGGAGPLRRALSPLRHAVTAAHDRSNATGPASGSPAALCRVLGSRAEGQQLLLGRVEPGRQQGGAALQPAGACEHREQAIAQPPCRRPTQG